MKPCEKLKTASRFLDRVLSKLEQERFEKHLEECADCREFVGAASTFSGMAKTDTALDYPSPELEKLLIFEATRAQTDQGSFLKKMTRGFSAMFEPRLVAYAVAALVLGLALGGAFQKFQGPKVSATESYLNEAAPLFETEFPGSITTVLSQVEGKGL